MQAGWDGGISSSESERFSCGALIDEIGGGLSLISANKAMIWSSSKLAIESDKNYFVQQDRFPKLKRLPSSIAV